MLRKSINYWNLNESKPAGYVSMEYFRENSLKIDLSVLLLACPEGEK